MSRLVKVHGMNVDDKGNYKCFECKSSGPLLYGFRIRVNPEVVHYICRCRGCGRVITVEVEGCTDED